MFSNKGFYEELESLREDYPESDWGFLENETTDIKVDERDISAYDFLHGFCVTFAYALYKEFGYKIQTIYDDFGNLVHGYCIIPNGDEPIYVDVRGCTTDFSLLIGEFNKDALISEPYDIKEETADIEADIKNPEVFDAEDLQYLSAAERLIRDYKDYYRI